MKRPRPERDTPLTVIVSTLPDEPGKVHVDLVTSSAFDKFLAKAYEKVEGLLDDEADYVDLVREFEATYLAVRREHPKDFIDSEAFENLQDSNYWRLPPRFMSRVDRFIHVQFGGTTASSAQ